MTMAVLKTFAAAALAATLAGTAAAADGTSAHIVASVDTRGGPGAYYAAGLRFLAGASVKVTGRSGGWVMAEVEPKRSGWIPAYVLDSAQQSARPGELLRSVTKDWLRAVTSLMSTNRSTPPYVNRSVVSLGIRGFSSAYSAHKGMKASDADPKLWEGPVFDASAYQAFVKTRFAGRDWESLKRRLPLDTPAPVGDPESDKLGAALTAYVAHEDGLIRNAALEEYLSEIAMLVAESSHAYDLPVRVYVLNSAEPKGFVSPNGIVFVSAGALGRMQSEAEFAFFVGHEIAHIAFQHGLRKINRDEQRANESAAFDEMDKELGWDERTGDKYVRTSQELTEMADEIHEYFQRENNDHDELEADYWGLIYAARAGYVPEAAESLLLRMVSADAKGDSALLWNGVPRDRRLAGCRRGFQQIKLDRTELRGFESEFRDAKDKKKAAGK
jgi:hypothetical protein